jgi:polysaccharide biosynthesis transport protein
VSSHGSGRADHAGLREHLNVLQRGKWWIAAITVVTTATAMFFSFRETPVYQATTRVLVKPTAASSQVVQPPDVNLATEREVVASEQVAQLARTTLGVQTTPAELLEGLDVHVVPDSEILNITYSSTDPDFARAAADAFANGYIEYQREEILDDVIAAQRSLEERIQALESNLTSVTNELEDARGDGDDRLATALETERATLVTRIGILTEQMRDLRPDPSLLEAGQIIQRAATPQKPVSPNHLRNGIFAAFLGLLAGVGAVFLRDRLDERLRDRAAFEAVLGAPVLGAIPRFPRLPRKQPKLMPVARPSSVAAEAYRTLRTTIQFAAGQDGGKSLLITSATPGEGKSITTANLAVTLAQAGQRVVVVSADLRRPAIDDYFSERSDSGLSTFLAGRLADPWELVRKTRVPNVRLVGSGPIPFNPAELLQSPHLARLVRSLEEESDIVLFDSPPTLGLADSPTLAAVVPRVVLVVDPRRATATSLVNARTLLEHVGARVIGAVVNNYDLSLESSSYASADYYYSSPSRSRRRTKRRPPPPPPEVIDAWAPRGRQEQPPA